MPSIFALMKRVRAIFLLLVYSIFSSFAVASSYVYTESTSEGTEKEVIASSLTEHREVNTVRLTAKKHHQPSFENQLLSYNRPVQGQSSFQLPKQAVPAYIMHCVFRL